MKYPIPTMRTINGVKYALCHSYKTKRESDDAAKYARRGGDSVRIFKTKMGYSLYSDGGAIKRASYEKKRKRLGLTVGQMILRERDRKKAIRKKKPAPKNKKTAKPKPKCKVVPVKAHTRKCPTK